MFERKFKPEVYDWIVKNKDKKPKESIEEIKNLFGVEINIRCFRNIKMCALKTYPKRKKSVPTSFQLKPIGTERKDKDGYIRVVVEGGERLKHHLIWEEKHEPLKSDEVLIFLDGDKTNCDISNLYLMKRKYMGALNWYLKGLKDATPELRKSAILAATLKIKAADKACQLRAKKGTGKPKKDEWRFIVENYLKGMTARENAKAVGKGEGVVRWTIRRYKLGCYDNF